MEHTVSSQRVTSGGYPRISSDVSEICFQSRVLESTLVDGKQMYTIEYQQGQAGQQGSLPHAWPCGDNLVLKSQLVGQSQLAGHANITINCVTNQASTKTFQSCDIDKMRARHEDCVFQFMIFAGILHHSKILCKELGINHLTYGKNDAPTGIGGFTTLLGFRRCVCTDMTDPSKCCIAIPSAQRLGQDVLPHALTDLAQGARTVGANVMHSASSEDDPSTKTCRLDRVDMLQKKQRRRGKKVYCTHWLSKGNCAYMQQGCIYKHEIPKDQETWESLGFHTIPGWLHSKSSAWIDQHSQKSPDLSKDLAVEKSTVARRSQAQINPLQNLREDKGDRQPAHTKLKMEPDLRTFLNVRYPSSNEEPSSSDRFVGPRNKRLRQSSFSDITRMKARDDCDDWGHTRNPTAPRYQQDSFLDHVNRGPTESSRLHSADSIDDPGCDVSCASRNYRGNSYEPSNQPPRQWSAVSTGSTSGASYGNSHGEDPVLQASQFLGDWQIETPDVVWGSYPSHEPYPPKRPHHLRDSYRPGKR